MRLCESSTRYLPSDLAMTHRRLAVHDADCCVPTPTALFLGGGRFRVEAAWRDFTGRTGLGRACPLDGGGAIGAVPGRRGSSGWHRILEAE